MKRCFAKLYVKNLKRLHSIDDDIAGKRACETQKSQKKSVISSDSEKSFFLTIWYY